MRILRFVIEVEVGEEELIGAAELLSEMENLAAKAGLSIYDQRLEGDEA
jgi:hypothetical protein